MALVQGEVHRRSSRGEHIVADSLRLNDEQSKQRAVFAARHRLPISHKRLVRARVYGQQQQPQQMVAAPSSSTAYKSAENQSAVVAQHVATLQQQLADVTQSQRQQQKHADKMITTFMEHSQAQMEYMRDLGNPAKSTPWIVTLPNKNDDGAAAAAPSEVLAQLHESKQVLSSLVQETRTVLSALQSHKCCQNGDTNTSSIGYGGKSSSGAPPLDAYLARRLPFGSNYGVFASQRQGLDDGSSSAWKPPTAVDSLASAAKGYDLADATAVLARVKASKRALDLNIDAMVDTDLPFDPEAILRQVLSDARRAATPVDERTKPKSTKLQNKPNKSKGTSQRRSNTQIRPKTGPGQAPSKSGVRSVNKALSNRATATTFLPRNNLAGPQSNAPLVRPLWSATPNNPRPHARTSTVPPSPARTTSNRRGPPQSSAAHAAVPPAEDAVPPAQTPTQDPVLPYTAFANTSAASPIVPQPTTTPERTNHRSAAADDVRYVADVPHEQTPPLTVTGLVSRESRIMPPTYPNEPISPNAAEMQLREMLAQSILAADLRTGYQLEDVSREPPSLQSRISRPVAQYTSSSRSSSPSIPDVQPPALPQFDDIVRETLLAFASGHAAELTAAKKVMPLSIGKVVDMVDVALNPRTPTPGPSLHNAVTSPVMWAQRHQTTQADSEHQGERRKGSPLAVSGTGTNPMTPPVNTNVRCAVDTGLSPMPQYGHDAGVSPMPMPGGRDIGLTPMPMPSGRDIGLTPMPQYGHDAGVSPMPIPGGRDVGLTPMPPPNGRDIGSTPMPQYGHDAGVSPMPMPGGRDVGLTPIPQQGHDAGVSPVHPAGRLGASDESNTAHSLPDWWTRVHQMDGSGPVVHLQHRTELTKSLDPEISDGEILLSSDGETFPSRKLPADAVGADPFDSVRGTILDDYGSDFSDSLIDPLPIPEVELRQEEQMSEGQLSRGSMSEGEEAVRWSRRQPQKSSRIHQSGRPTAFPPPADSESDALTVSEGEWQLPLSGSTEEDEC